MSNIKLEGKEYKNVKVVNLPTNEGSIARYCENVVINNLSNRKKYPNGAVVFIDDDCRSSIKTKLLPTIKAKNIPYGFACPPNSIGKDGYLTLNELKTLAESYDILSHHWNQEAMNSFKTVSDYDSMLNKCDKFFTDNGIEVEGICYPNGIYSSKLMSTVRSHYRYGFTVDRGTNRGNLETYYLKRVEAFPANKAYTIDFVKYYIDEAYTTSGLMVVMTHCWYDTFNATELANLIDYVAEKSMPILSPSEAFEEFSNLIECGDIKMPLIYHNAPFYCVSRDGVVSYNSAINYTKSDKTMNHVNFSWSVGTSVNSNGKLVTNNNKQRLTSEKIAVNAKRDYLITANNIYANLIYAIYDSSNTLILSKASDNTEKGTLVINEKVTMPENASYMYVCCNLDAKKTWFEVSELTSSFNQ